jgi:uncharacterized membrane protein YhaH (DUF805 family)
VKSFLKGIGTHLRRLADFRGRETIEQFWPYAFAVLGLCTLAVLAVMLPGMGKSMQRMQEFARTHPDQATVTSGPGQYSISIEGNHPEFMPDFGTLLQGIDVIFVIAVALLAAAVTRRLHDRGLRGWWGLLPLPFVVYSLTAMPRFLADPAGDIDSFFLIFASNFLYLASLGILALLLSGKTRPANRFGPPPAE